MLTFKFSYPVTRLITLWKRLSDGTVSIVEPSFRLLQAGTAEQQIIFYCQDIQ